MDRISIGEQNLRLYLKLLYPLNNFHYNIRPTWLKSAKSNRNLEIDIFCPERMEGWEFQWVQHYKDAEQVEKDKEKKAICKKLKIKLHRINLKQLHEMLSKKKTKPWFDKLFKNVDNYLKIAKTQYNDISAKKKAPALAKPKKKPTTFKKY